MKKLLKLTIAFLCVFMVGCSTKDNRTMDEKFIDDLKIGLQERWKISDSADETAYGSKEHLDTYTKSVDCELNKIKKYEEEKFENETLKNTYTAYMDTLNKQKDALTYLNANSDKYDQMWNEAYNERVKLIKTFVDDFGLKVDEKHQKTLDDMLIAAQLQIEKDNYQVKLDEFADSVVFDLEEGNDGYSEKYVAIVENITGKDLEYLHMNINLYDANDVILETAYSSVENFKNGEKARFEFYTEHDFDKYQVTVETNDYEELQ